MREAAGMVRCSKCDRVVCGRWKCDPGKTANEMTPFTHKNKDGRYCDGTMYAAPQCEADGTLK